MGLACEHGVLTLLVLARDRKRRAVALVRAKANGAGRGERGAEGGIDDDGAAAEERQPTRDDVQLTLVGRNSRDGEVADARARGDLGGGAARLTQELREGKFESLTATRQAPGRTTHKEVVALRVHLGTTRAARRSGGNL